MKKHNWVDINWIGHKERAILLIPVKFDDFDDTQYLQIDTACPHSTLFGYQLSQILQELPYRCLDETIY